MGTPKERCLRIPYGESSYESVRENGTAYVDKTRYLEILEESYGNYLFFVRPRRFGKTLFTSMLQSYYDMCEAENFEQNFRGTYIYDHKTPLQGKYRVLFFEFAGMSSGGDIQQTFQSAVKDSMTYFFNNYPVEGWENFLNRDFQTPSELLSAFFAFVHPHFKRSLYVIIDEYDQFANEILSRDRDTFKSMTSSEGFLKDFYAKLKFGTTRTVARVFITGVTAVSLDSMTSGFNIAENITTDELMATMMGFDDDELKALIEKTVGLERFNLDPEQIFRRMKDYYDGYRFSRTADKSVFNPQMCFHYLRSFARDGKEPESMTDSALKIDLDKLDGILMETGSPAFHDDILERILYGQKIAFGRLSDNINPNSQNQFSEEEVLSILFYLGMLTYAPDGSGDLVCPNKAVREQFFNLYFKRAIDGHTRL